MDHSQSSSHHKDRVNSSRAGKGRSHQQRLPSMFLASLLSLFKASPVFVWQPAVRLDDPQIVSTLMVDYGR